MSKTSIELTRHALNGPTMGTRWSALFFAPPGYDPQPAKAALQAAVEEVDAQMSTWRPDSDLMRFNAAAVGAWVAVPARMRPVIAQGLAIGRASGGAFDIGLGDAVTAWGFGPGAATADGIRSARTAKRVPAHDALEIDAARGRMRKVSPLVLDLNGIAKGYGVDRLSETLGDLGIAAGLVGIDGELRARGLRPDGQAWTIAIEAPDIQRRLARSILALQDAAVATSGDYRHWVQVQGHRLSHTMAPQRSAPLAAPPASVTVVHESCMAADAWATALMVTGSAAGADLACRYNLNALFLDRAGDGLRETRVGPLFAAPAESAAPGGTADDAAADRRVWRHPHVGGSTGLPAPAEHDSSQTHPMPGSNPAPSRPKVP